MENITGYYILGIVKDIKRYKAIDIVVFMIEDNNTLYQCTGLRNKNFEKINVGDKVGLYVDCKINKYGSLFDIMINEMYIKLTPHEKGLFYGISKVLKEDKNIKKLLNL